MYICIGLFPDGDDLLSNIMMFSIVIVTLKTLMFSRRFRNIYLFIAVITFGVDLLYDLANTFNLPLSGTAQVLLSTSWMLFFGLSIILVSKSIYTTHKVTFDTVIGGICVFLMLGFFWGLLFIILSLIYPGSFSGPNGIPSPFDLMYFSFTTLTTLGYGEFTPVSRIAKLTSVFEAICGVLYPAIFISALVNSYQYEPSSRN